MFGGYEKTFHYQLSPELLTMAMNEAVDRYLALHQNVFPTDRQDASIELKVQKSYVSRGEKMTVSVKDSTLYVASRCIESSSGMVWVKNWHNVLKLSSYINDVVEELSCNAVYS